MNVLMTADTVGGVFTYALELAGALGRRGVEVADQRVRGHGQQVFFASLPQFFAEFSRPAHLVVTRNPRVRQRRAVLVEHLQNQLVPCAVLRPLGYAALLAPRPVVRPLLGHEQAKVHQGVLYTDTGFWDTFRAAHPLYNLLFPEISAEILQSLLNSYDQSGWLPSWSSPGHRDCMIGNHSFSLLADDGHKVCELYGVWGRKKMMGREYDGVFRTTFVIAPDGKIVKVFENVKPEGHSAQVLEALAWPRKPGSCTRRQRRLRWHKRNP